MVSRELTVFVRMFLRTYLVGGCINTRGMQNIGLSYAMDPGLRLLYPLADDLQKARKRYLRIYNTHPCWTPLLVGLFFYMEKKILKGLLPPKALPQMKSTIAYTLSAVGDSLFGGSIYVFWSLSTMVFLALKLDWIALVWAVTWILVLEGFKLYTFWQGISQGIPFLVRLKSWNLINWSGRIKVINAILLFLFWIIIWPGPKTPLTWMAGTGGIMVLAWLAMLFYRAREVIIILVAVLAMAMPILLPWVQGLV
jgi:PTS system mannose-specific IID component